MEKEDDNNDEENVDLNNDDSKENNNDNNNVKEDNQVNTDNQTNDDDDNNEDSNDQNNVPNESKIDNKEDSTNQIKIPETNEEEVTKTSKDENDDNSNFEFHIEDFQKMGKIGQGSFAHVYKGMNTKTGELVAIKIINLDVQEDELADIQQEISVLRRCDSPYIVKIYGSFIVDTNLWIIMEFVGVGTLSDLIKPTNTLEEQYIQIVIKQILLGLEYLHSFDLIHRDLKAVNILLSEQSLVKIADFGVCGEISNTISRLHSFVGTPFWMAPEVIKQEKTGYNKASDIWSLGICCIELATGKPPHWGKSFTELFKIIDKKVSPKLDPTKFSKDFVDFVSKCCKFDPSERATAKELLQHKFIKSAKRRDHLRYVIDRFEKFKELNPEVFIENDESDESDDPDAADSESSLREKRIFWDYGKGKVLEVSVDKNVANKLKKMNKEKNFKLDDIAPNDEYSSSDAEYTSDEASDILSNGSIKRVTPESVAQKGPFDRNDEIDEDDIELELKDDSEIENNGSEIDNNSSQRIINVNNKIDDIKIKKSTFSEESKQQSYITLKKIIKPALSSIPHTQDLYDHFNTIEKKNPNFSKNFIQNIFKYLMKEKDLFEKQKTELSTIYASSSLFHKPMNVNINENVNNNINNLFLESKLKNDMSNFFYERWKNKFKDFNTKNQ